MLHPCKFPIVEHRLANSCERLQLDESEHSLLYALSVYVAKSASALPAGSRPRIPGGRAAKDGIYNNLY